MSGQAAAKVDVRLADPSAPSGYVTLAGLRTRDLTLTAQTLDASHVDSVGGWQERLSGSSLKRARLRGTGVFKRADTDALLRQLFLTAAVAEMQILLPAIGTLTGPMQITSLSWSGGQTDELAFALTLESAGPVVVEVVDFIDEDDDDA